MRSFTLDDGAFDAAQWVAGESHEALALADALLLIVEADGER